MFRVHMILCKVHTGNVPGPSLAQGQEVIKQDQKAGIAHRSAVWTAQRRWKAQSPTTTELRNT